MTEANCPTSDTGRSFRRRVIFTAAIAIIGVACAITAYRVISTEKDYAQRKAHAISSIDRRADIDQAIADLKAVVQRRPNDAEALSALARAMLLHVEPDRQNVLDAVRIYSTLLELEPTRIDERFELVRLLDLLGESDALLKRIAPLLEVRPQDAMLHRLRTLHLMRLSRPKETERAARLWSEAAVDDFAAQWAYVSVLAQDGKDPNEPDSFVSQKLTAGVNHELWTLVRAVSLLNAKQTESANALLDQLLGESALPLTLHRPLILALDEAGRRTDADRVLSRSLEAKVDESLVVLAALREMDRSNYTRALELLEHAPLPTDRTRSAIQSCVTAFIARQINNRDLYDKAWAALNALPIENSAPWRAVLTATGAARLSATTARELLPSLRAGAYVEDGVPLLQLAVAQCLASINQVRSADRVLSESARASVGWSPCARQLFELRRSQGQIVQAIEAAQFAFNKSGRTIDSAINLAQAVAESKPTGTQADNHFQLLREIQRAVPGEIQTIGLYVEGLARRGDASAASVLREALTRHQAVPLEYLLRWAELSQQKSLGLEEECFARAQADFGSTPRLAFARAMSRHRAGKTDEGMRELRAARGEAKQEHRRAYEEAIATFLLYTHSADAAEAWSALAAAHPDDVSLQIRLLDLGVAKSPDETQAIIARIRKAEPGNLQAELAEIRLSLASNPGRAVIDEALPRLNRVVERAPELIAARLLLVDVLMQANDPGAALTQWEKAVQLAPDDPNLLIAGAQLLISNGERTRAGEVMQKIERLNANLTAAQRMVAAQTYLALGIVERTIDLLKSMSERSREADLLLAEAHYRAGNIAQSKAVIEPLLRQGDLDALLFAAAIEDAEGRREGADALLQRAQSLNELRETDRLRIAQFASERGGLDRVVGILSNAEVSDETMIRIARLWIEQGNVDVAMKALRDAAGRKGQRAALSRRLEEEPNLRTLVELKLHDVAAQLLETPDDAGTRQMVEFVLATQKQTVREQQVSLDRLATTDEKNYALQMFVADRFLAMNQPVKAETHARLAAQAKPSVPQPMALAAVAAARAGNTGRCVEAIKEWRDRLPIDNTQPDALDARNFAKRREYSELLARYEPRVASARGQTSFEVVFAVAQAMHARGREEDAIAFLKPVIEADSRASIHWLEILANDVEPASAWKSLEAFRKTIEQRQLPSERVELAIAMDSVARRGRGQAWAAAPQVLLESMEAQAGMLPVEAVIRLAEYQASRGRLDTAERIYRRGIEPRTNTPPLDTRLAEVLRRESKLDEALLVIDRSLASGAQTPLSHDTRAAILQDLGRFDEALAAAESALRLDQLNPRWLLRVASIHQAKGDVVSTREALETLRWFLREPEVWDKDLIERLQTIEAALTRRGSTTMPS
jgi:tetratricopeptide (TPR) repeat protein